MSERERSDLCSICGAAPEDQATECPYIRPCATAQPKPSGVSERERIILAIEQHVKAEWTYKDDVYLDGVEDAADAILARPDPSEAVVDMADALKTLIARHGYEDDNTTPKDWSEWVAARAAIAAYEGERSTP